MSRCGYAKKRKLSSKRKIRRERARARGSVGPARGRARFIFETFYRVVRTRCNYAMCTRARRDDAVCTCCERPTIVDCRGRLTSNKRRRLRKASAVSRRFARRYNVNVTYNFASVSPTRPLCLVNSAGLIDGPRGNGNELQTDFPSYRDKARTAAIE